VGGTLDSDRDAVMEEVGDKGADAMEVTDAEGEEESEETELSESAVVVLTT
jgi:hypothetical protein